MRSWQIRNILTTIALVACCGFATGEAERVLPGQPSAPSEVKSEPKQKPKPKQNTTRPRSKAKKSTKAPVAKGGAKATAPAKSDKAPAQVKSEKVPALKGEKVVPPAGITTGVTLDATPAPYVGLHEIKERARWAPAKPCADTNKKLEGTVRAIDKEASKKGDRLVMARMAVEFRTPAEAILAERTRLRAGWGELVVAHTLLASTPSGVTIDHLFEMREEGLGWGQISHGLGFNQKDVATAIRAEGRVIQGKSKPNGSPPPIASVEPQVVGTEGKVHPGAPTPEIGTGDAGTSNRGAVTK